MGFQKLSLHPLPPLSEVIIVKTEGQKKNHLENNYDSNYHSPFLAEEIRINPGERVAWGGYCHGLKSHVNLSDQSQLELKCHSGKSKSLK